MGEIVTVLFGALKSGSLYALIGLGFVVVYLSTGAINFAHGEYIALGGLTAAYLVKLGYSVAVAAIAAVVLACLVGYASNRLLIRPLGRGAGTRVVLVTIGFGVLLRQLMMRFFGPDELTLAPFVPWEPVVLFGARFDWSSIIMIGVSLVAFLAVWLWFRFTRQGRATVATEQSIEGAQICGVRIDSVVTTTFVMAAALGALAGIVLTPVAQMAFESGVGLGIKGFTAAIFGGLTNPVGAIGAGIVIGLMETLTATYFDPTYKDAVALVVLIAVLILKPDGLFSFRTGKRRG